MGRYRLYVSVNYGKMVEVEAADDNAAVECALNAVRAPTSEDMNATIEERYDDPLVTVRVSARGYQDLPVFMFERRHGSGSFSLDEETELVRLVARLAPVIEKWNGTPYRTLSVAVDPSALPPGCKKWG